MLDRILVATDGSANARRAEQVAGAIAGRFGGHLVLAHAVVAEPSDEELGEIGRVMESIGPQQLAPLHMDNLVEQVSRATGSREVTSRHEAMRELGEELVRRAERRAREAGAEHVTTRVLHGDAAGSIVKLAREEDVDLIVVGTRGIGGLRGRLLGSVSQAVMRDAPQSTLVVKE